MTRVAFLNISAAGHVIPTLGLVAELINRGEEVVYYTDAYFQKEIEAVGASFCQNPAIDFRKAAQHGSHYLFSLVSAITWQTREILSPILELVKKQQPDYIIHDSVCLWGRLVAELLNIPAVNSIAIAASCSQSFYQSSQVREKILPLMASEGLIDIKLFRQYEQEIRETYGTTRINFIDTFTNTQPLNICYLAKELQPDVEKFDERFHFIGVCNSIRATKFDFPIEELQTDKPIILISFGSAFDPGIATYHSCIEAFQNIDAQIIMTISPFTDPSLLGNIPANFIVRPTGTIPQLAILERASLFITHGGAGGIREAVWYSVPMIAIPQMFEQEMLSQRMEEQGAGIIIPKEKVNPEVLQQGVQKILNDESFRANSRRLGNACRTAEGTKRAVDEILKYVHPKIEASTFV